MGERITTDGPYRPYDAADETFFGAGRVVAAEYDAIWRRRGVDPAQAPQRRPDHLVGLALSGGGIRSASFCLGVLQALAHGGWLRRVDYLSTVSGGGYIGASLTWLLHRAWDRPPDSAGTPPGAPLRFGVANDDFPYGLYPVGGTALPDPAQGSYRGRLLRYLRQNARYLTPGGGLNLLSLLAVLLRNAVYSLTVYGGLLLALFVLAGPWLFDTPAARGWTAWTPWPTQPLLLNLALLPLALLLLAVPLYSLGTSVAHVMAMRRQYRWRRRYEILAGVVLGIALVTVLVGSLPAAHRWLTEPVAARAPALQQFVLEAPPGGALPPRTVLRELPPVPAAGAQAHPAWWPLLTGGGSALLGVVSSVLAFVRTQRGGSTSTSRGVTTALVIVGTAALVLGLLLLAYDGRVRIAEHLAAHPGAGWWLGLPLLGLLLIAWAVNTNYVSVHRYYRDRLMETFMPDATEALKVHGMPGGSSAEADRKPLHEIWPPETPPPGPYPIVNTNVVLVSSRIPKFRGRGGDNFVFSPLHCGSNATGWIDTRAGFGWMTLASAMAISGAAVNPNTGSGGEGVTRQPLLSFLMGLLNIRLGYWVLNPMPMADRVQRLQMQGRWRWTAWLALTVPRLLSPTVPNALWPGLSELVLRAQLDENSHMLQLTDGGHFENLGLYELVRRRLPLIVCCDAGADAGYTFGDLANAIEKVRADFGAIVEIDSEDLERLTPRSDSTVAAGDGAMRFADRGFLVARITYPQQGREPSHGTLIYLTTTFFRDLTADLYGYRRSHPDFPDQPTADQFFDEKQFDAYRELGYQTAWQMLADADVRSDPRVLKAFGPPPWAPAP